MIISINKETMTAIIEVFRASTSDSVHELSWWTTHRDEAEYYAKQSNSVVRSRALVVPIRSVIKGNMNQDLFQFKINNTYIFGTRGKYTVSGIEMVLDELSMWVDGSVLDVFTVRDEDMYYSVDSCVVFCLGKNVADRQLELVL